MKWLTSDPRELITVKMIARELCLLTGREVAVRTHFAKTLTSVDVVRVEAQAGDQVMVFDVTEADLKLSLEQFRSRILAPIAEALKSPAPSPAPQ